MELREVAPHVFAALVPDRGWSWSNAGFVARGDGLMVDTFMDVRRTREALALLADAGGRKPAHLVNTHHNVDHCWGNQLFREREIYAHRRAPEHMAKDLQPAQHTPSPIFETNLGRIFKNELTNIENPHKIALIRMPVSCRWT